MLGSLANRTISTGPNLAVMCGMNSAAVDLVYLIPPFDSNRTYEVPMVVLVAESVEAHLLLVPAGRRRTRRLGLQYAMHALVPPVLLRLAGLNPLQADPASATTPPDC